MRRIAVVAVLVVLLVSSGMAFAFQNEPTGFRGLSWGTTAKVDMTRIITNGCLNTYVRSSDKLWMGEASLTGITYRFLVSGYHERLFSIGLHFNNETSYYTLKDICEVKFGEPTKELLKELVWNGDRTIIILDYSGITREGSLNIADKALSERYREERRRQEAEQAESDW